MKELKNIYAMNLSRTTSLWKEIDYQALMHAVYDARQTAQELKVKWLHQHNMCKSKSPCLEND